MSISKSTERLTLETIEAAAAVVTRIGDSWHSTRRIETLEDLCLNRWSFVHVEKDGHVYERESHRIIVCPFGTTTIIISPFASRYSKSGREE